MGHPQAKGSAGVSALHTKLLRLCPRGHSVPRPCAAHLEAQAQTEEVAHPKLPR